MSETLRNWAGNYVFSTARVLRPETLGEVRRVVAAEAKLRALGTRHSFSAVADSDAALLSTEKLTRIVALDRSRRTVTVEPGVTYGQLGEHLQREGLALHNLASLPHISVAGGCATGTHGSGVGNGGLASAVRAMQLVRADGSVGEFSRETHGDSFDGMIVALGALGVVTRLTLDVVPAFDVCQFVFEGLPLAQLGAHFSDIMSSAYSVSFFTDWQRDANNLLWLKHRADQPPPRQGDFLGAPAAKVDRHPIVAHSAENCTPQLGVAGPSHERLPHFRMAFTPSSGDELQSEYFVAWKDAAAAIAAVARLHERITPHLLISEIRVIAADDLWLSPCYGRASVSIHFTWKPNWTAVRGVLPAIELALAEFSPRPHWAKMFTVPPGRFVELYPRLADFRRLAAEFDPHGKFRNAYLDSNVFERR